MRKYNISLALTAVFVIIWATTNVHWLLLISVMFLFVTLYFGYKLGVTAVPDKVITASVKIIKKKTIQDRLEAI